MAARTIRRLAPIPAASSGLGRECDGASVLVSALVICSNRAHVAGRHEPPLDQELADEELRAAVQRPVERLPVLAQPECRWRAAEAVADSSQPGLDGPGPAQRNSVLLHEPEHLLVRLVGPVVALPLRLMPVD